MYPVHRIAVIDDNRFWRETLSQYLRDQGLAPLTAEDGVEGLRLLESTEIRLAIIDLHMPGMDGLELLRQLRRRRQPLAVLMVSSEEDPTTARQALAAGARAFLPKHISLRSLMQTVRQALEAPSQEMPRTPANAVPLWQRLLPAPRVDEPASSRTRHRYN